MKRVLLFFVSVTFAVWWGGLTLFPTVVFPTVTGTAASEYIQHRVTGLLNIAGFICTGGIFLFLLVFKDRAQKARKQIFIFAFILFMLITSQIVIHPRLLGPNGTVTNDSLRMLYITIAAISWVIGGVILWRITNLPYEEQEDTEEKQN